MNGFMMPSWDTCGVCRKRLKTAYPGICALCKKKAVAQLKELFSQLEAAKKRRLEEKKA